MRIKNIILSILCFLPCFSMAVYATTTVKEKIRLHDMDCRTFLDLGPEYHGKMTYWAASHAHHHHGSDTKEVHVNIKAIDSAIPKIVEDCKKSPGTNFYETVKIRSKRH